MAELTLVVGNQNYSSWSLRPWLAMRMAGIEFDLTVIPLDMPETKGRILEYSEAGRVPVLRHGELTVWESLAICEYVAELAPSAGLWPENAEARAIARAVSGEMHAGFGALRAALPMNLRADRPGVPITAAVQADIDRITRIWRDCRQRYGAGGPFLFGRFSIADAMFAPVVARFETYHVPLGSVENEYADAVRSLAPMRGWRAAAKTESWTIEADEVNAG